MSTVSQAKPAPSLKYEAFVEEQLSRARRRIWLLDLTSAGLGLLTATLLYGFAVAVVDRWLNLPAWLRQSLLVLYGVGALVFIARTAARPLFRRVNPYYAAKQVEHDLPGAMNSVVNWLDLRGQPLPPAIRSAVTHRAAKDLARADLDHAISARRAGWLGGILLGFTLALLVLFFILGRPQFMSLLGRTFAPFVDSAIASRTHLTVVQPQGGNVTVPVGRAVTVLVQVDGRIPSADKPDALKLLYRYQNRADDPYEERLLERGDHSDEWTATVQGFEVHNGFWYKVAGGDTETPEYRVQVRSTPLLTDFEARYHFRPYLNRADETTHDPNLEGIRGTEVTLVARTNRTVKDGRLVIGDDRPLAAELDPADPQALRFRFPLEKDGTYRIWFTSVEEERNTDPMPYTIKVVPDRAPEVQLTAPGKDIELPANGILRLEGSASDDFGLARLTLKLLTDAEQSKPYREGKSFRLDNGSYPRQLDYEDFVELEKVKQRNGQLLQPGMVVEYWLEATDNCDYPEPNVGRTERYKIKITEPEDPRQQARQRQQAQQEQQKHEAQQDQKQAQDNQAAAKKEDGQQGDGQGEPKDQNADNGKGKDQNADPNKKDLQEKADRLQKAIDEKDKEAKNDPNNADAAQGQKDQAGAEGKKQADQQPGKSGAEGKQGADDKQQGKQENADKQQAKPEGQDQGKPGADSKQDKQGGKDRGKQGAQEGKPDAQNQGKEAGKPGAEEGKQKGKDGQQGAKQDAQDKQGQDGKQGGQEGAEGKQKDNQQAGQEGKQDGDAKEGGKPGKQGDKQGGSQGEQKDNQQGAQEGKQGADGKPQGKQGDQQRKEGAAGKQGDKQGAQGKEGTQEGKQAGQPDAEQGKQGDKQQGKDGAGGKDDKEKGKQGAREGKPEGQDGGKQGDKQQGKQGEKAGAQDGKPDGEQGAKQGEKQQGQPGAEGQQGDKQGAKPSAQEGKPDGQDGGKQGPGQGAENKQGGKEGAQEGKQGAKQGKPDGQSGAEGKEGERQGQQQAQEGKQGGKPAKQGQRAGDAKDGNKKLNAGEVDQLIKDLQNGDATARRAAADQLKDVQRHSDDPKLCKAAEDALRKAGEDTSGSGAGKGKEPKSGEGKEGTKPGNDDAREGKPGEGKGKGDQPGAKEEGGQESGEGKAPGQGKQSGKEGGQPGQQANPDKGDSGKQGGSPGKQEGNPTKPGDSAGGNPGVGTTGDRTSEATDTRTALEGTAANKAYQKKAGVLQLDTIKKKVTPDVLKKANMTELEYKDFLKAYEEMLKRKQAEPGNEEKLSDPKARGGSLSNRATRRVDKVKGKADTLQHRGEALAPPEFREAYREFTQELSGLERSKDK
jgi:hypothetical protein